MPPNIIQWGKGSLLRKKRILDKVFLCTSCLGGLKIRACAPVYVRDPIADMLAEQERELKENGQAIKGLVVWRIFINLRLIFFGVYIPKGVI